MPSRANDGGHGADEQYDSAAAAESLKATGGARFVAPPGEGGRNAVEECLPSSATTWRGALRRRPPDLAEPLLRESIARDPEQGRYYLTLAACLMRRRIREGCLRC